MFKLLIIKSNILLALSIILLSARIYAHNPDNSTSILSEQEDNAWVLQVRAALTAFEYEIHRNYGRDSYSTPKEFQELVMDHVFNHIALAVDKNAEIGIQKVGVKLGHESTAVLKIIGLPDSFKQLKFENSSFENISRNKNVLIILKKGYNQKQFILNNKNDHTVYIDTRNNQLLAASAFAKKKNFWPPVFKAVSLIGLIGLIIRYYFSFYSLSYKQ